MFHIDFEIGRKLDMRRQWKTMSACISISSRDYDQLFDQALEANNKNFHINSPSFLDHDRLYFPSKSLHFIIFNSESKVSWT